MSRRALPVQCSKLRQREESRAVASHDRGLGPVPFSLAVRPAPVSRQSVGGTGAHSAQPVDFAHRQTRHSRLTARARPRLAVGAAPGPAVFALQISPPASCIRGTLGRSRQAGAKSFGRLLAASGRRCWPARPLRPFTALPRTPNRRWLKQACQEAQNHRGAEPVWHGFASDDCHVSSASASGGRQQHCTPPPRPASCAGTL